MVAYPPVYDELFVISDLHMGGRGNEVENFQIFKQGARLARFITYVADRPAGEVALVLNGDVFDSLAEEEITGYVALDANSALSMMEHLYTDEAFAPVWQALTAFILKPRRHLVFIVGNHDIELALPVVEHSIRSRLAGANTDAWGRMTFSSHGAGFTCCVGGSRIFCTHGNELDPANWVDYSALGQLANAITAGRRIEASRWVPNAGTRLVVDAMNVVKRRYPFVDLLKPEGAAFAAVLLMLDLELIKSVDFSNILPFVRQASEGWRETRDLLGDYAAGLHERRPTPTSHDVSEHLLGPSLRSLASGNGGAVTEDELLLQIETERRVPRRPTETSESLDTLGGGVTDSAWRWLQSKFGGIAGPERLRRALQDWLLADRTFELQDYDDPLFLRMRERVHESVNFVITGHTHKPRAMTWRSGHHYFNTGTWIRTLQLPPASLDDPTYFKQTIWPILESRRMSDLDNAQVRGTGETDLVDLVRDRTYAARIAVQGHAVVGQLLHVTDVAGGVAATPVDTARTVD